MRVALTGTPGTGKSDVATYLQQQGYTIVRINDLAKESGCIDGLDRKRDTKLIDIKKLNRYIEKNYTNKELVFFEGHVAHLLRTMEKVIILRCHPQKLQKRLGLKKWKDKKIQENVDAETLDVILSESSQQHPTSNIFEIDTTNQTIDEVGISIEAIAKKNFRPIKKYSIGQIDWSEEILKESLS